MMYKATAYDPEAVVTNVTDGDWKKGEEQPASCRDAPFAGLFLLNIAAIAVVVALYSGDAITETVAGITQSDEGAESSKNYAGILYASVALAGLSFILSTVMLSVMMKFANILIKISLLFSVVLSLVAALLALVAANIVGAVFGFLFFAISVCYARSVWSRIPFATANLITGLTAVKANFGVVSISYLSLILAFGWTALWSLAFAGVYDQTVTCDGDVCEMNYGYLFLLFLSYYWTHQVLMNIVHVTVAGTVGTWWFAPDEASSCCSSGVTSSLFRALTYSFGSICFGSLLVAIIQALRQIANQARQNGDANAILICVVDCILGCLEGILEYFNKWAYVYVGLYGYSYLDAGKNVMTLIKNRGWDVIIADNLVGNALGLVSLIVGLLIGGLGLAIDASTDWFDNTGDSSQTIAFVLGFIVGLVLSSIMFSVVASSVNATIILFAEAPAEFQTNHPALSENMRAAYLEAYPDLTL